MKSHLLNKVLLCSLALVLLRSLALFELIAKIIYHVNFNFYTFDHLRDTPLQLRLYDFNRFETDSVVFEFVYTICNSIVCLGYMTGVKDLNVAGPVSRSSLLAYGTEVIG